LTLCAAVDVQRNNIVPVAGEKANHGAIKSRHAHPTQSNHAAGKVNFLGAAVHAGVPFRHVNMF
jgi:hypothetical protein